MKKYLKAVVIGTLLALMTGCGDEAAADAYSMGVEIYSQETGNEGAEAEGGSTEREDESPAAENKDTEAEGGNTAAENEGAEAEHDEPSYYGTWAVKDYQSASVSSLSAEEIGDFFSYTVTYQADAVFQNGQNMNIAGLTYESEEYTEDSIVQEYKANLGEWWNEKSKVTRIFIASEDYFFGNQFFVADDDVIWIYYEGVFFLARKD